METCVFLNMNYKYQA